MADRVALAWGAFDPLFALWMRGRVAEVRVAGPPRPPPPDASLLLCPNHVSWWDGFLVRRVQRVLRPAAPLRTVMLAEELRRHPFLRLLGAVGMEPGSLASVRGAARTLARLREEDPSTVTVFFPQGAIWPSHRRPLGFQPGIRLFRRALEPVWTLPVALHLEFLGRSAATAFVAVGDPLPPGEARGREAEVLEARVEAELDAIRTVLAREGEDAPGVWPPPERRPMPSGRSRVAGPPEGRDLLGEGTPLPSTPFNDVVTDA